VGGGPAVLVHNGIALNASESADGGTLFFADAFDNARIWRLQTGRREAEPLADMPRVRFGTAWELAGGGIYFVEAGGGPATVAYYDFASRSAVRVAQLQRSVLPWTGLTVSPLDRSLLYSQVDEEASDIMLAEIVRP
jgi:hypothetical protein